MSQRPSTELAKWIERISDSPLPARQTSPNLLRQLQESSRRPVDRLLCISADSTADGDLIGGVMREQAGLVSIGYRIISDLLDVEPEVIDPARAARLLNVYPSLDLTLLIKRLFKRRHRHGGSPTDVGVFVIDAISAWQVAQVDTGSAVERIPILIDDHVNHTRSRVMSSADQTVSDLLRALGVGVARVKVYEGPRVQRRAIDTQMPVGDTEQWLHCTSVESRVSDFEPASACTRCGDCASVCPVRVHPAALLEAAGRHDHAMAEAFSLPVCIECGLCSEICPSRLPIVESLRSFKVQPL